MELVLKIDENGELQVETIEKPKRKKREGKGKSLLLLPDDYVVLDLETTGLDPQFDSIIEIGLLRIRNKEITERFDTLVNPHFPLPEFISELTGIRDEDLQQAPDLSDALRDALDFIGKDIIVGHNVNFDINFLYDSCQNLEFPVFNRDFVDTMRIARKVFPELPHHRLIDLVELFGLSGDNFHRAQADVEYTWRCFELIKEYCIGNGIQLVSRNGLQEILIDHPKVSDITTDKTEFDRTNPIFGQNVVFTGVLERMTRRQAAQIVADLGGHGCDNVTKKTNFLVLGNNDYCSAVKDGKSTKQKKAEKYQLEGLPIQIISENVFYDMIEED